MQCVVDQQIGRYNSAVEKHREHNSEHDRIAEHEAFTGQGIGTQNGEEQIQRRPQHHNHEGIPVAGQNAWIAQHQLVAVQVEPFREQQQPPVSHQPAGVAKRCIQNMPQRIQG
ncbi:hypothetical protein D3C74_364100 [compost metagenome]